MLDGHICLYIVCLVLMMWQHYTMIIKPGYTWGSCYLQAGHVIRFPAQFYALHCHLHYASSAHSQKVEKC